MNQHDVSVFEVFKRKARIFHPTVHETVFKLLNRIGVRASKDNPFGNSATCHVGDADEKKNTMLIVSGAD